MLIEQVEAREAVQAGRSNQQALDDWYLNRLHSRVVEKEERNSRAAAGVKWDSAVSDET